MQFIGRIGNLLDGIDGDTTDSPKNHEALSRGADGTTTHDEERKPTETSHGPGGGLMGRGFGFLTSAAAAAGNVTGSLRELVSDEGGGGSLEAKIAAWDPFGIIDDKDSMASETGEDRATEHKLQSGSHDASKSSEVVMSQSTNKVLKPSDDDDLFGGWDSDSDGVEEAPADSKLQPKVEEPVSRTREHASDVAENEHKEEDRTAVNEEKQHDHDQWDDWGDDFPQVDSIHEDAGESTHVEALENVEEEALIEQAVHQSATAQDVAPSHGEEYDDSTGDIGHECIHVEEVDAASVSMLAGHEDEQSEKVVIVDENAEEQMPSARPWRVCLNSGAAVRKEKTMYSELVREVHRNGVVHGTQEDDWLRLSDGSGYCLIRLCGTVFLEESKATIEAFNDPIESSGSPEKKQHQPLEDVVTPVRKQVTDADASRKDKEISVLKEDLASAQMELLKEKAKVERLEEESSRAEQTEQERAAAAQSEVASLTENMERLQRDALEKAQQHKVLTEEISNLRDSLEQKVVAVTEASNSAQEESAKLQSLSEQKEAAQDALAEAKSEIESLRIEASSRAEQEDQQLAVAKSEVASMKNEVEKLQADSQQHLHDRAVAEAEIVRLTNSLEQQAAALSQAGSSAEEEIATLQALMDKQQAAAHEELSSVKAELERLQVEASSGVEQKDHDLVVAQIEILNKEIEPLRGVVSSANEEISKLKNDVDQHVSALSEAKSGYHEELTRLQAMMAEQKVAAEDELAKTMAKFDISKAEELGVVQAEVARLTQEIERLRPAESENAANSEALLAAEEEIAKLQASMGEQQTQAQDELSKVRAEVERLQGEASLEIEQKEQQLGAVQAEVTLLKQELERLKHAESENTSRSVASTGEEEISRLRASNAELSKRADEAEASLSNLKEEHARLEASISQTMPPADEGKLVVELERKLLEFEKERKQERESLLSRAKDAERRLEQIPKDDAIHLPESPSESRIRSVVGSDSTPKGKQSPESFDLEAGSHSKPSETGCAHEADRPLHFISRQLSASQLWRRVFFSYLLLLHLWTFFILHRHS